LLVEGNRPPLAAYPAASGVPDHGIRMIGELGRHCQVDGVWVLDRCETV
jgi:hypothetical protein